MKKIVRQSEWIYRLEPRLNRYGTQDRSEWKVYARTPAGEVWVATACDEEAAAFICGETTLDIECPSCGEVFDAV